MGTKDTITKDYMADNRVFADVFNHMPVSYTHLDVYKRQP